MKKISIAILLFSFISCLSLANTSDTTKISGKPILRIYSNFHQGITEAAHESNFDVKRAYLGYAVKLDNGFSGFVKVEIASPDAAYANTLIKRSAYFRNVGVAYKHNKFSMKFGIVDNQQHKTQENFWDKRYLMKSYLDQYKFFPSTDLGINATYKFNNKLSIEFGIMSGQYLNNDANYGKYIYNIGIDYSPIEKICLKVHTSYNNTNNDIYTAGFFMGYKIFDNLRLAAEYNTIYDINPMGNYIAMGYSGFAIYDITDKINIFARYDILDSNTPNTISNPHNLSNDGSAIVGGIEYIINQNLRASINYQDWTHADISQPNTAYIFFNIEFGLFGISYKEI